MRIRLALSARLQSDKQVLPVVEDEIVLSAASSPLPCRALRHDRVSLSSSALDRFYARQFARDRTPSRLAPTTVQLGAIMISVELFALTSCSACSQPSKSCPWSPPRLRNISKELFGRLRCDPIARSPALRSRLLSCTA